MNRTRGASKRRPAWQAVPTMSLRLDELFRKCRRNVEKNLQPLVENYFPAMQTANGGLEYRKMLELSTKMAVVGMACTWIAGYRFDERRLRISSLFGACCFLGDGFLDDFGAQAADEYLQRYELLLTKGWFEIRDERERLFYIVLRRLFSERDVLEPMLRQSIWKLFLTQKRDVELRSALLGVGQSRRSQLQALRECARDRSGHAITLLSLLLVPTLALEYHSPIYSAGSLIMYIDDHGDCHIDRYRNCRTYMNQVKEPARTLRRIFVRGVERIHLGLPKSKGKELLIAFLHRYCVTRLRKHCLEKSRDTASWTIYE
jgi:hypothetical protein